MVALSAPDAGSVWNQLEVVMANWRRFEDLVDQPGPFISRATRSGLGKVNIDWWSGGSATRGSSTMFTMPPQPPQPAPQPRPKIPAPGTLPKLAQTIFNMEREARGDNRHSPTR
ncbi:MAG: hypothetical protein ACRDL5_08380 [Solirubrobacteraceae bacterium]